jgi:hypothetical protein
MYHANKNKGKCDLQGGRRQVFVEWEGQNQPEIILYAATEKFTGFVRWRNQFHPGITAWFNVLALHVSKLAQTLT